MGYCYESLKNGRSGRLVCDHCGGVGTTRKRRCPHGYCPAQALCRDCWLGPVGDEARQWHVANHCQAKHEAFVARGQAEEAARADGKFLFCAALGLDTGAIKLWFKGAGGSERVYLTNQAGYELVSALRPYATDADLIASGQPAARIVDAA